MVTDQTEMITVREGAREAGRTAETVRPVNMGGQVACPQAGDQLFVRRTDMERLAARIGDRDKAARLAAFYSSRSVRDRISRRLGSNVDVLGILD